jgi:aryl-alcohol dehydrogenase-like predicted oxidoreductase
MRALTDDRVGTLALGGKEVRRLGFGAMRVAGARNVEGTRDRDEAVALCRRVYERGVNFIDVANVYGYGQCEEILREALHPYPPDLVIATKAGFLPGRIPPGQRRLPPCGDPGHIREECEKSLRRLQVDCIDLYQVHVPDPDVPYAETVGAFVELQHAGKVRDIGVSNVTVDQLGIARALCDVVSVQNAYNVGYRRSESVFEMCQSEALAFIPHSPIQVTGEAEVIAGTIADAHGVSMQQVGTAWLLQHSPQMLPIPGTSNLLHAEDNIESAWLELSADEVLRLDAAAPPTTE